MRFTAIHGAGLWLGILLGLSWATQAGAVPSVDLYFVGRNGAPVADATSLEVAPGDLLDVEMRMTTDERGVLAYSITVDFDSAGHARLIPTDFSIVLPPALDSILGVGPPWGPDHPDGAPGFVRLFNAATLDTDPDTRNKVFAIGRLSFEVTSNILDGPASIAPGLFYQGVDEILSNDLVLIGGSYVFDDISAEFAMGSVTLTAVPEPSTALLLGAAMISSLAWRRWRAHAERSSSVRSKNTWFE
jgi:hypothetical protein